ncbi:hypothetical protein PIROE2DRAFT_16232 [Piromyces sp. E2]|nr:hypothetical protein PIROE2DRAFT_16232 [Piromyces sp. E2]|eukprot:OUM58470.1 hypothetical protein PIROE2DRAFT_16232 [Piromyces sp. E2]
MSMRDNYSVRGGSYSQHHNHYNKNVEITGSGDYTPPGFFELLWMTFSSVLDITTDIWYAESLFTNNVEIHYKNKWIFQIMSILTIVIPIVLNMTLSFSLISRRLKASFDFLNWYRTAPWAKKCTSFFVLFSAFNIELLSILVSGLWGLACFSAPIGIDDFWFRLKFWGFITTLAEDIPQFLIQFLILYPQIRSGKINTLVVMKLMIAAIVLIVDCISKGLIWYAMGSSISPPKKDKNIPFDEQATLGFPTSYSYTDNDPTTDSISYSRSDSAIYNHHNQKNKHHKIHNDSSVSRKDDYSSSYNDQSVVIPKRKYFGVEETFADKLKEQPKYYHDFSYKNDTIIDVIDSDDPSIICNNNSKHPNDNMMNHYKRNNNNSYSDDTNSESYESYYLESSHSHSVYTENNKDITENISISSQQPSHIYHHHHHHPKEKNTPGKKVGFEESIMIKDNNKPSLYSKNVIIRREGLALPAIKMEKSPSFIPPSTYGNLYDFNEVSSDVVNINRRKSNYYNNHRTSPNNHPLPITIKDNHRTSPRNHPLPISIKANRRTSPRNHPLPISIKANHRTSPRNHPLPISIKANHRISPRNHPLSISIKDNHRHHISNNKIYDKGTIRDNNNKRHHRNRKYEESDISKEINKIQQKNKNEEEIIYIDNIRYNNMFKL